MENSKIVFVYADNSNGVVVFNTESELLECVGHVQYIKPSQFYNSLDNLSGSNSICAYFTYLNDDQIIYKKILSEYMVSESMPKRRKRGQPKLAWRTKTIRIPVDLEDEVLKLVSEYKANNASAEKIAL